MIPIPTKTSTRQLLEGLQSDPLLQEKSFLLGTLVFRELEGKLRDTFLLYYPAASSVICCNEHNEPSWPEWCLHIFLLIQESKGCVTCVKI